jgi:hypothetical protein
MATADDFIERAAGYIGVSGTDNIFNTWYWGFPCYDPKIYPWCANFQSYVGVNDLGMPFSPSASASGVAWQGEEVADGDAQRGDWVLFNWDGRQDFGWADHIGVVEWFDHESGFFGTIEGNTGDTLGGEVARCTRNGRWGYATKFFRPPYDTAPRKDWPVQMYPSNGTDAQKWRMALNGDGTVTFLSCANGYALDVAAASSAVNTRVQTYEPNGSDAQKWLLKRMKKTPDGTPYYPKDIAPLAIAPLCAKKMRLDVAGASDAPGAVVQLYKANSTPAQQWYVLDNSDGTFSIFNNGAGAKLALDVVGGGRR